MTQEGSLFTPRDGAHYLHPQKTSKWPRRYVFMDTEAFREKRGESERQTWRLGVTATVNYRDGSRSWSEPALARHPTPESLWERVTGFARKNQRTVVVAHNLAYDLRISQGMDALPAMGWALDRPTFVGNHISLCAVKDNLKLELVDSATVIPKSIKEIGSWSGIEKPDLPDNEDPEETWYERCEADCGVLATAYMSVVRWLDTGDLGGWARTVSGMGWHALLRNHLQDRVLVHNRPEVRDAESAAMYTGRAEAWQHGYLKGGPWHEWDYSLAYAHVCAETSLPAVLVGEVRGAPMSRMSRTSPEEAWLVQADIDQSVPVLPAQDELGVFWPTGSFSGWYWLSELQLAETEGVQIRPRRAWRYQAAPWLQSWGEWCIGTVEDRSTPDARIRSAVAKHWQRAIVGRSAMRYRDWVDHGEAYRPGVEYSQALDLDTGDRGAFLTLGGRRWEAWRTEWWDQALHQLLSAVMAECRVRLWGALRSAGLDHVAYCDTDSLITDPVGHMGLAQAVADGKLGSLRYKGRAPFDAIKGPQFVEGATYRRLAGVPRAAKWIGPGRYEGERWEGITTAMAKGRPSEVWVHTDKRALAGIDTRRVHLPGGQTRPYTVVNGVRQLDEEVAS